MPTQPLVSIVTIAYNAIEHIEDAIRSVTQQCYSNIEYIVVDGGSSDGTLDVIRDHQGTIDRWLSERDFGVSDAWNKGIAVAQGELVKLLNADDLLTPGSVERAVEAFSSAVGQKNVFISDLEIMDKSGSRLSTLDRRRSLNPLGPILHPTWYVPRTVYDVVGRYRTDLRTSMDYEMYLRMHARGVRFAHRSEPYAAFRLGGVSNTGPGGLAEGFTITRSFFGPMTAARFSTVHAAKKLRAMAAQQILGSSRFRAAQSGWHHR
jgi:glycosyltransferase involved in cell wall biosynthesis